MAIVSIFHRAHYTVIILAIVCQSVAVDIEMVTIPNGTFNMNINPENSEFKAEIAEVSSNPIGLQWSIRGIFMIDFSNSESRINYRTNEIDVKVRAFQIGKFEVTQAQWLTVMGALPDVDLHRESLPVSNVSWYDAVLFCNELSKINNMDTVYVYDSLLSDSLGNVKYLYNLRMNWHVNSYRLPTEAEWEYAARGGSSSPYFWGDSAHIDSLSKYTVYNGNIELVIDSFRAKFQVPSVGSKKPNGYGVYDMAGSVSEWVNEWFSWFGEDFSSAAPYDSLMLIDASHSSWGETDNCPSCNSHVSMSISLAEMVRNGTFELSSGSSVLPRFYVPDGRQRERIPHVVHNAFCKIARGGNFSDNGLEEFKLSHRVWACPSDRKHTIGFRVVLPIEAE